MYNMTCNKVKTITKMVKGKITSYRISLIGTINQHGIRCWAKMLLYNMLNIIILTFMNKLAVSMTVLYTIILNSKHHHLRTLISLRLPSKISS